MSDRVNLGPVSRFADERVVLRNRAVVVEAKNLSDILHRILRPLLVTVMRRAQKQRPVRRKKNARRISAGQRGPGFSDENLLHILKRFAVETSSSESSGIDGSVGAVGLRLRHVIGEIDQLVFRE